MGQRTDAAIAAWQKHSGIEPAEAEACERLQELSQAAYELIQIVELEKSGIRDGDGHWYGSDPLQAVVLKLHDRWQAYRRLTEEPGDGNTFLNDFLP